MKRDMQINWTKRLSKLIVMTGIALVPMISSVSELSSASVVAQCSVTHGLTHDHTRIVTTNSKCYALMFRAFAGSVSVDLHLLATGPVSHELLLRDVSYPSIYLQPSSHTCLHTHRVANLLVLLSLMWRWKKFRRLQ
jgi:hypothetical protein